MFGIILAAGLAAGSGGCGCATTLAEIATAVETNYAGHVVKLPDENARASYRRFRDLLIEDAGGVSDPARCRALLDAYLAFFADDHLFVKNVVAAATAGDAPASDAVSQAAAPEIPLLAARWTPIKVRQRLRDEASLDPVEGLWRDAGGELAIVHDDAVGQDEYVAFRFRQHRYGGAGEILAFIRPVREGVYDIHYMDADGVWQKTRAALNDATGILTFAGIGWQRTTEPGAQADESAADETDARATVAARAGGDPLNPVFRDLGDGIHYLSLPSFMPQYREPLNKIIAEHSATLAEARGLIIDVRGNGGGDAIYYPLADYFLTGPIIVHDGNALLASPWNIEYFEEFRAGLGERGAYLDPVLQHMRANPGRIVPYLDRRVEGPDAPRPGPRRIVVLQDRGVGSEAEAFLLHAGQSGKVVTMGEPSKGNIDYQQVNLRTLGCGDYRFDFGWPLVMRTRNLPADSLDDSGIAPDVRLSPALGDWVEYAARWLRADSK